jgi:AraC family transcriptional regulator
MWYTDPISEKLLDKEVGRMSELDVRIVQLEPLHVACAHGFGESPESQASEKMLAYVESSGLDLDDESVRWFGFDNPSQSPGSPNYGYDVWVTVGPEAKPGRDVKILDFPGGLYGVARCTGVSNIGEAWQILVNWLEDSQYRRGHHQWLEELLTPPDVDYEDYRFDLYIPIAR